MRIKNIIAAVLATGGLLFGAWNWMNYFKQNAPEPPVQAGSPVQSPAAPKMQEPGMPSTPQQPAPQAAAMVQAVEAADEKADTRLSGAETSFPRTPGRNPFLTPEEIELIASGRFEKKTPEPEPREPSQMVALPPLTLNGLILDKGTGNYKALIDGKVYDKGDMVGVEEVLKITETEVVLKYAGRTRTLVLAPGAGEAGLSPPEVIMKKVP